MLRVVREFTRRYPDIEPDPRYIRTRGQKIEPPRNNVDLGFVLGPFRHPQIEMAHMREEDSAAIPPADHRLSTCSAVTLEETASYPLAPGKMGQWETFRFMIDDLFTRGGHRIDIRSKASDALGIRELMGRHRPVGSGGWYHPVSARKDRHQADLGLRFIDFDASGPGTGRR